MNRLIPIPGDLIIVESSQWYALKDGQRLRVCEHLDWIDLGEELTVAPRHQVNTFWGPEHGPLRERLPMSMSTSGGPFKTVKIKELQGLELVGEEEDTFWCWQHEPLTGGCITRKVIVAVWRIKLLTDDYFQEGSLSVNSPSQESTPNQNEEAIMSISSGSVRLGCKGCDRRDFDYIFKLPSDWKNIELNLEQGGGVWETHLGLCPECQAEELELSKLGESEFVKSELDPEVVIPEHPIIKQIIDRDCHVGTPTHEVVRHIISKLKKGYDSYRALLADERAMLVVQSARHHRSNFKLYVEVMSGFSKTVGEGNTRFPSSLSGKEIVGLMRKHRVSIRSLAFRLGTTLNRIREVRSEGLQCPLAIRDWLQAITGDDPGPIPKPIRITLEYDQSKCEFCGLPLLVNDSAYSYVGEVYCSVTCCRTSRGW